MADRTCPKCFKEFEFPSRLDLHVRANTTCNPLYEGKVFTCTVCNKRFGLKRNLVRHMKDAGCIQHPIIKEAKIKAVAAPIFNADDNIAAMKADPTIPPNTKRILELLEKMGQERVESLLSELEKQYIVSDPNPNIQITDKSVTNNINNTDNSDNSVNNNTINNTDNSTNTINNNNYHYHQTIINPVGCEDLSMITVEQLDIIYANIEHSTGTLLNYIYSNVENQNFCKDNVNKRDMKYLAKDKSVSYTIDYQFIDVIKESLLRFHLSLIYNHKHSLPIDKFKDYLSKITIIEGLLKELEADTCNDDEEYEKDHNKHVKNIISILMNKHSRDKSVNGNIKSLVSSLKDNEEIKAEVEKRIKMHTEGFATAFSEYSTKSNKPRSLLLDERNLNLYKIHCIKERKDEQLQLYKKAALP